jgi:hypothetical protein
MRCCDEESIFGEPGCLNARKGDGRPVAMGEILVVRVGLRGGSKGETRDAAVLLEVLLDEHGIYECLKLVDVLRSL